MTIIASRLPWTSAGIFSGGRSRFGDDAQKEDKVSEANLERTSSYSSLPGFTRIYQDPSRLPTIGHHGWPSAGGKKQMLTNTPHVPQVMIKLPLKCINSLTPQRPYHHPNCSTPHTPDSRTWTAQHPTCTFSWKAWSCVFFYHRPSQPERTSQDPHSQSL